MKNTTFLRHLAGQRVSVLAGILLVSLFGFSSITGGPIWPPPRWDVLVIASIWGPRTIDPAWCYDTASAAVIMNVYDTLLSFKVNRALPPGQQGLIDEFVGNLAVDWLVAPPRYDAPDYTNSTFYFKIRCPANGYPGVPYHDHWTYGNVTPSDIEYSFERWMAFDRSGGPTWMIYERLLDIQYANWSDPNWATKIDNAVESNSTHVWFNLKAQNYPPLVFMQVIAQPWAGIMPQAWAADNGCWPGLTYTNANMTPYYDPQISPLDTLGPTGTSGRIECGSGPYKLSGWFDTAQLWHLDWFEEYWQGWPAPGCAGYLKWIFFYGIDEWGTRKAMFLTADADVCYVPRCRTPEMVTNWASDPTWETETYPAGVNCWPNLPTLELDAMFFNFNITVPDNPYMDAPPYDQLHEDGIPYWFFNDFHVRKAFAYSFNYTAYIAATYHGEAKQPSSPHLEGLAYDEFVWDVMDPDLSPPDNPDPDLPGGDPWSQPDFPNTTKGLPPNPMHYCNLTKAKLQFQFAHAGQLANTGFTLNIPYNAGNEARKAAALMLKNNVEALSSKFHINVIEVDWPTYLDDLVTKKFPLFFMGWLGDFTDPHAMYKPLMHSNGAIAKYQSYNNSKADRLIERGVNETDDNKRIAIYWRLCNIYFQDCPSVPLVQPTGRHWERDWMSGWYYNPIYGGSFAEGLGSVGPDGPVLYFYHLWKEVPTEWGEVDISASTSNVAQWLIADHGEATVKICADTGLMCPRPVPVNVTVTRLDAPGGGHPAVVYVYIALLGEKTVATTHLWAYPNGFNTTVPPILLFGQGDSWKHTFHWTEVWDEKCGELEIDTYNMTGHCYPASAEDADPANDWDYDGLVQILGPCDGNGDNVVNLDDLLWVIQAFWSTPGAGNWDWRYDVDCDNDVDVDDLLYLIDYFWTIY